MKNDMIFHHLTQALLMLQQKWQIIICKSNGCLDLQPDKYSIKNCKKNCWFQPKGGKHYNNWHIKRAPLMFQPKGGKHYTLYIVLLTTSIHNTGQVT